VFLAFAVALADQDLAADCHAHVEAERWGQAKMACKIALGDDPDNAALLVEHGVALWQMNELEASERQLRRALELGSEDPRIEEYLPKEEPETPPQRAPDPAPARG